MMEMISRLEADVTMVTNEFVDRHMAQANGEYVKVYLYILRHRQEDLDIDQIAEALNHTDADVRRALAYWEKAGVLSVRSKASETPKPAKKSTEKQGRPLYSPEQIEHLGRDEDFTQLLYIAQKYMNKIFSQRDVEVFAYLYDGLGMNAELLEYLVEYCAQSRHTSLRYIETVALSWKEKGFATVEEAQAYAESFQKNTFSVMKAFGLTDRRPGEKEKEMIDRWFHSYGFSRDLVVEACNRSMKATHSPSFQYAEKVLAAWKAAGVRSMRDVAALDENHQKKTARTAAPRTQNKPANQFHNFEQRDTDYDTIVMEQIRSRMQT